MKLKEFHFPIPFTGRSIKNNNEKNLHPQSTKKKVKVKKVKK